MKYIPMAVGLCLAFTISTGMAQDAATAKSAKAKPVVKTKDVQVKGLTLKVPDTWEKKANSSSMRLATYQVKPVEGETDNAELTVFNFPNQDIKQNVDRWVGQFLPNGRKSKTVKGMCPTGEYYLVEASGAFKKPKPGSPPFRRETIEVKGYRMLGVILPVKGQGMYFLKLTGPDKTVAAQAKLFRGSFSGKKAEEKEFK